MLNMLTFLVDTVTPRRATPNVYLSFFWPGKKGESEQQKGQGRDMTKSLLSKTSQTFYYLVVSTPSEKYKSNYQIGSSPQVRSKTKKNETTT